NTVAYLISRFLQPVPLFDMLSRQDGLDLPSMEEQRESAILRVEDAMRPNGIPVLTPETAVADAVKQVSNSSEAMALVRLGPGGWSTVRRDELEKLNGEENGKRPLRAVVALTPLPHLHPDHTLDTALRYIYDWPLLPVVHRADFGRLEGILTMPDILRAYRHAGPVDEHSPAS
ncbi:MAG TPA: CBS domain-containing protein, partial [Terriglobales bacterium]|nr:CBS domain-containing protein [Terriglobales bacterium]